MGLLRRNDRRKDSTGVPAGQGAAFKAAVRQAVGYASWRLRAQAGEGSDLGTIGAVISDRQGAAPESGACGLEAHVDGATGIRGQRRSTVIGLAVVAARDDAADRKAALPPSPSVIRRTSSWPAHG